MFYSIEAFQIKVAAAAATVTTTTATTATLQQVFADVVISAKRLGQNYTTPSTLTNIHSIWK